jgi:hypothetical protein
VNIVLLKNPIYNVGGVNKKLNYVRPITYDIVDNCIAFSQLPITNYQLPITSLNKYDNCSTGHDIKSSLNHF